MGMQKQIYPATSHGGKVPRRFSTNRSLTTSVLKSRLGLPRLRTSEPVLVPGTSPMMPGIRQQHIRRPYYGTQPQTFQPLHTS